VATRQDVRRIALSLPDATVDEDGLNYRVNDRLFAWAWRERVDPKKARVPNPDVLVVRVGGDIDKQVLLASDTNAFFTEPHYDGYAAVLVRLPRIERARLKELVSEAYELVRAKAPRRPRRAAPRPRSRR
jgi:hypothetical protein